MGKAQFPHTHIYSGRFLGGNRKKERERKMSEVQPSESESPQVVVVLHKVLRERYFTTHTHVSVHISNPQAKTYKA